MESKSVTYSVGDVVNCAGGAPFYSRTFLSEYVGTDIKTHLIDMLPL